MRIVVLGAAGPTGREVVRQASEAGHEVVGFVRSTPGVPIGARTRFVTGDATRAADLEDVFREADAVISTLGGKGTVITDSTSAIITAARAAGIKRVTVLSSFAVQRNRLSTLLKTMTALVMRSAIADKTAGEAELRSSDLDWTIVYATALNDGPQTGAAHTVPDDVTLHMTDKISRSDVAGLLIEIATGDVHLREAVTITG